jgi:predicted lipid carrier protein YhbT
MMTIPAFELPALLGRIGRVLPQWPHSAALSTALNTAVAGGVLRRDDLQIIDGRVVRIVVADGGSMASVTYQKGRFKPVAADEVADVTFQAPMSAFLQLMLRQEDPDTLFFNRRLLIEGDTELGLAMKNMLDGIELPAFLRQRAA